MFLFDTPQTKPFFGATELMFLFDTKPVPQN